MCKKHGSGNFFLLYHKEPLKAHPKDSLVEDMLNFRIMARKTLLLAVKFLSADRHPAKSASSVTETIETFPNIYHSLSTLYYSYWTLEFLLQNTLIVLDKSIYASICSSCGGNNNQLNRVDCVDWRYNKQKRMYRKLKPHPDIRQRHPENFRPPCLRLGWAARYFSAAVAWARKIKACARRAAGTASRHDSAGSHACKSDVFDSFDGFPGIFGQLLHFCVDSCVSHNFAATFADFSPVTRIFPFHLVYIA